MYKNLVEAKIAANVMKEKTEEGFFSANFSSVGLSCVDFGSTGFSRLPEVEDKAVGEKFVCNIIKPLEVINTELDEGNKEDLEDDKDNLDKCECSVNAAARTSVAWTLITRILAEGRMWILRLRQTSLTPMASSCWRTMR